MRLDPKGPSWSMNTDQLSQAGLSHTPQDVQNHAPALINLYSEPTRENESHVRSIFMYVIRGNASFNPQLND
jgi:hypothetical protein